VEDADVGVSTPVGLGSSGASLSGAWVWRRSAVAAIVPGMEAATLSLVDPTSPDLSRGPDAIRLLIAHGDNLSRAGLEALLDDESDIAVVESAGDGEEAFAKARELRPNVLLLDIALTRMDGVEVTRRIVADPATSDIHVVILGDSEHDDEVLASLRAGATGFLPRNSDPGALIHGLRTVAAGDAAISPSVVRRMISELASRPDPGLPGPEQLDELTPREREVMGLVAGGLSNHEIAEHLVISTATAKTHVSRALYKLHARDRAQLVTLAYETGLVLPRQPALGGAGVASATLSAA
jgi:DNA-binding NarL/FixJ family response regulator